MDAPRLRPQMTAERLDQFCRAWIGRDLDELEGYLTRDVVYSPLSGEVVRGREAVLRRFAQMLASDAQSDLRFEPAVVSGSLGTCRWLLEGRTAEGAAFAVEGIDVFEFDGDRIRSKDAYQKG